jgi:hypothetical protein
MKKFVIPLLACTALAGAVALAAPPHPGTFNVQVNRDDMQRHHAEMCSDMYAHAVGHMAFLAEKLSLTPAQKGAFENWKSVKLAEAKAHSGKCGAMAMPAMDATGSPLEHMAREEEMLKTRLADLEAERPVLTAFYNALSDAQKKDFAMEGGHGLRMMMMRHHRMEHGGDHNMMFMRDGEDGPPPQGE